MVTASIGKNAKRIRCGLGMTQVAVAHRAGISLATYQKVESGSAQPRVDTLYKISSALRIAIHDLLAPVRELSSVRFRAQKKLKKRDNVLAKAAVWLDDFNYLLESQNAQREYTLSGVPPELAATQSDLRPIEAAELVRARMGLKPREPIHDIAGLLASNGIKLLAYPLKSDAFFGMSIGEEDGGPAVVVNVWDRISVERWIFSAAHELGHLMMHLDAYCADIVEEDRKQEEEADLFASHLLMPQMGFEREWTETRGLPFWVRVYKIKRIFHVSDKTVLYRLLDVGIVDRQIWRKRNAFVKANFGVRHPNKFEPVRLKDYDFVPDWLDGLVRQAVESETISVGRAAEILGLSLEDMRGRVNTWVEDSGAAHT